MTPKKPDWWKYEKTSNRVYVDPADDGLAFVPLIPNYPGTAESNDLEPQRCCPLYFDFERGGLFYYAGEADDLGAN